jgi:hypothetical protein
MALDAVEAFVHQISTGLGVLLGLNYYAMVWSFFGALIPLTKTNKFPGLSAIGFVLFSMMLGALLSTFIADFMGITKSSAISLMAVVGGASWQSLIAIAIRVSEESFKTVISSLFSFGRKPPNELP